ncbi:MAG: alkene reductase [Bacteroidales bacterium]|nr:alkene reductase [Bacteroidales bacterium]
MTKHTLFDPCQLGDLSLSSRIVMAPLTRGRAANNENKANDLIAEYYRQRATAGLLITEGSQISRRAVGYHNTPGIYSKAQIEGWKLTTRAVHQAGGKIFIQLWHVGRISHPDYLQGLRPLAPSAIDPKITIRTPNGKKPSVLPQEMTQLEIHQVVADFAQAGANAMEAGFDGVEIHASNGYLLHQFFAPASNIRMDEYGGNPENRSRILFELLDALTQKMPVNRIGVRLNPSAHEIQGLNITKDTLPTFDYLIDRMNDYPLAFLHLSEPYTNVKDVPHSEPEIARRYRPIYKGNLMINRGFTAETAMKVLDEGLADLVAFGVPFIANPDLVYRMQNNLPLAIAEPSTYYTPGAAGYTDYPALDQ